jgi:hypothetical protein
MRGVEVSVPVLVLDLTCTGAAVVVGVCVIWGDWLGLGETTAAAAAGAGRFRFGRGWRCWTTSFIILEPEVGAVPEALSTQGNTKGLSTG